MKVILEEKKMGTSKEWSIYVFDDRVEPNIIETCWLLLPKQKEIVEELVKQLRGL